MYPRVTGDEDVSLGVLLNFVVPGAQVRPVSSRRRERTLSGLHNKRKARVNSVGGLLGLLCWGHLCE